KHAHPGRRRRYGADGALLHGGRADGHAQGGVPEVHRFLDRGRHAAGARGHHQISAGVLELALIVMAGLVPAMTGSIAQLSPAPHRRAFAPTVPDWCTWPRDPRASPRSGIAAGDWRNAGATTVPASARGYPRSRADSSSARRA